jgi:H+/Cl- antiporter ClcA
MAKLPQLPQVAPSQLDGTVLAAAGVVFGIISLAFSLLCLLFPITSRFRPPGVRDPVELMFIAIVTGIVGMALSKMGKTAAKRARKGHGVALTGLILSMVGIVTTVVAFILTIVWLSSLV